MSINPITILWIGGGLALVLLVIGIAVSVSSEKSLVEERLGKYAETGKIANKTQKEAPTPITSWLTKRMEGSSFGEKIAKNLARADIKMKPGEYVALHFITAFGVGMVAWYIGGSSVLTGIIGAIVGLFLPRFYTRRQQNKRLQKFNEQLADMLNLMVNGLRAGFSTMQSMEAVSKELPSPICDEFRRIVQEMQLGVSMEKTLENLYRRIPSDDLDLVITAINVQREVGGNLAEILDTISYTIRERVRIKGEIRTLIATVSYSGQFLSLMPVFVLAILFLLNREYMMEFFTQGLCGYAALGLAGVLIVSGYFAMQKIGNIEI